MAFDPNLPNSQQQDLESVLGAIRGNQTDLNDRIKAQENLSLAATKNEVVAARGSRATLNERLNVALDAQGNVKFDSLKNMTWIASGDVPTYVNAQSFTVPGDQTAKYLSGLVLRLMHGTTQIHSVISVASYVAGTDKTTVSLQQSLLTPALSSILIGLASLGEVLYEEALLKAIPTEPAWRSETEPALFDLAIPGQPLDAPFVFSRGGASAPYINALGHRAWTAPDEQADDYDPVTLQYRGKRIDAYTTTTYLTRQMWSGAVPGVIGEGGALPTGWSVLFKQGLDLEVVGTGFDKGYKYLDVRWFGTADATTPARIATGGVGSATADEIWTAQLKQKVVAGSFTGVTTLGTQLIELVGYQTSIKTVTDNVTDFTNLAATHTIVAASTSVQLRVITNFTPGATIDVTIRYTEPQVEKSAFPGRFVGANTDGASAVLAADVLTIGPVETGANLVENGAFDTDLSGWNNPDDYWQWSSGRAYHPSGDALQPIYWPLTAGKRYRVSLDVELLAGQFNVFTDTDAATTGTEISISNIASDGRHSFDFTAQGSLLGIRRAPVVTTEGYIDNVRVVELVAFEGWDSGADGHTILFHGEAFDNEAEIGLINLSDTGTNNAVRLARRKTPSQVNAWIAGAAAPTGPITIAIDSAETNILACVAWDRDELRLGFDGAETGLALNTPPAGLSVIEFGKGAYLTGKPTALKRVAFFNRKLSTADIQAMVTK